MLFKSEIEFYHESSPITYKVPVTIQLLYFGVGGPIPFNKR